MRACSGSAPAVQAASICVAARSINRYKAFKEFKARILVATDLFGRGIDIERVNIVINYDFPAEADQYLHRVGRAGRFGTKGLAISFISDDEEQKVLDEVQRRFEVKISELPETIDVSSYSELAAVDVFHFVTLGYRVPQRASDARLCWRTVKLLVVCGMGA